MLVYRANKIVRSADWRKTHKLKVANYVLFGDLTKTIPWGTASQTALRNWSKEVMEEPRYIGVFAGGGGPKIWI